MQMLPTAPDAAATSKGPAERFHGDVWVDPIAAPPPPSRLRVGAVHFAPGAHTVWHRHTYGQSLHVTHGVARVGTRDGTVLVVRTGQTVWAPPGEWHWHGAAPGCFMTHLAMSETSAPDSDPTRPDVDWGEPVTDEQYNAGT